MIDVEEVFTKKRTQVRRLVSKVVKVMLSFIVGGKMQVYFLMSVDWIDLFATTSSGLLLFVSGIVIVFPANEMLGFGFVQIFLAIVVQSILRDSVRFVCKMESCQ